MEPEHLLPEPLGDLELTQMQADSLAYLLASPAYATVFEPLIGGLERSMIESLIDPSKKRAFDKSDDYLRGGILTLRALRELPRAIVNESREREFKNDQERTVEQHYQQRADGDAMGPMGFSYNPDTDY